MRLKSNQTDTENKLMVTKLERGEELGDWDSYIHTTICKIDNCTAQGTLLSTLH